MYAAWKEVFAAEYDELVTAVGEGRETFIDEYAAQSPAEFYAVATEMFFTLPCDLEEEHPELYGRLEDLYCQNPAELCRAAGVDVV
jgi:Mlc titration factor MtfA (ptsG expression regulator)